MLLSELVLYMRIIFKYFNLLVFLGDGRRVWKTASPRLGGVFTGTGDLFAALFLGWYHKLGAEQLPQVLQVTLSTMQVALQRTKDFSTKYPDPDLKRPRELRLVQCMDAIMTPPLEGSSNQVVEEVPIRA
jgi:pyridoxine kinase